MSSLFDTIAQAGDRLFCISNGRHFSYADLNRAVLATEGWLEESKIRSGQVVALGGIYTFAAVALLLALYRRRCIVVPLVGTETTEADRRANEAGAEVFLEILEGATMPKIHWRAERQPHPIVAQLRKNSRPGLILFSSGTSGKPKGMVHDFGRLVQSYRHGKPKDLRILAFMGIDHIGGLDILFRALASQSALVIPSERSPEEICRLIEEEQVNVLPATPSFLNLLLLSEAYRGRDLSSLAIIGFGAERMPAGVLRRLREVFPNVRFQQKFGTSETNAVRTENREDDPLWIRIADPEVKWRIEEGELWLKTPSRILGYIGFASDRLLPDGWYRTGDLVEEGEEGFFRVIGRQESMINVGGEKVLPGEVEEVIRELPDVSDCRVYGAENAILGQVVHAEVVPKPGIDPAQLTKLIRTHCREWLALYKVPVKVRAVAAIELNERGKRGKVEL